MPENVSGPSGDPACGDSQQWIKDTLARLEEKIDSLAARITTAEDEALAELAELRRASVPVSPRRSISPRRRGDTVLRVVKAAIIGAAALAGVLTLLMSPARIHRERYTPVCTVQCARPVAHQQARR